MFELFYPLMLFSSHEVQPFKARPTAKRNKADFISPIMRAYFEFTSFGIHCVSSNPVFSSVEKAQDYLTRR